MYSTKKKKNWRMLTTFSYQDGCCWCYQREGHVNSWTSLAYYLSSNVRFKLLLLDKQNIQKLACNRFSANVEAAGHETRKYIPQVISPYLNKWGKYAKSSIVRVFSPSSFQQVMRISMFWVYFAETSGLSSSYFLFIFLAY